LATAQIDNDDRPAIRRGGRIEQRQPPENSATIESKTPAHAESSRSLEPPQKEEEIYEPEHFEEHKPVERGKVESLEKTGQLRVDNKTGIRANEENRARIEPIKKEASAPIKIQEPVKTDSVPTITRMPGGTREAQYSEKFKKKTEGQ
jgi:hypothetical protein